jgi:flagellin
MPTVDLTRIADNIGALSSLQSLLDINNKLSAAQSKLSTGKQINSAADDPAGLVIATKLNARSQGLKVAMNNISDAKNMMSVAEAGLSQITNILISMRNKATQAASDTLGGTERATIQTQLSQFANQIDDIVTQTKWNGVALLGGTLNKVFQTGVEAGETTQWNLTTKHNPGVGGLGISSVATDKATLDSGNSLALLSANFGAVYSGYNELSTGQYNVAIKNVAAGDNIGNINSITAGLVPLNTTVGVVTGSLAAAGDQLSNATHTLNIVSLIGAGSAVAGGSATLTYNIDGQNQQSKIVYGFGAAISASAGGGTYSGSNILTTGSGGTDSGLSIYLGDLSNVGATLSGNYQFNYVGKGQAEAQLQYQDGTAVSVDADGLQGTTGLASTFYMMHNQTFDTGRGIRIGAGTTQNMLNQSQIGATTPTVANISFTQANLYSVDVSSATKASTYMSTLDNAMDTVNQSMANLGSIMARMDIKSATASSAQINVESAYNTIMNANMAEQQVNASKYQVLQQTAVAMLAQSNQAPQALLSLFK